ncbi:hypothetical protein PVAND_010887 [Polypedilum vanderplanki]|uniref:Large ribosomal subunit protein uL23m n=1 Tax=Polypedilum vanderplanki TaxID=319348 RepID=A0A9J6CHN0_POLVA|nr:hypothetical protein PVAND_010887 [Polypedilum vanderplanki]
MSTRWYPLYQKGNPQLRVFLPNFWMKLLKPAHQTQPKNVVCFEVSMQMTKADIKNYLEKIYKLPVVDVRTRIRMGRFKREERSGYIIKEKDPKLAYVTLPKEVSFTFPDLFPEDNETKKNLKDDEKALDQAKEKYKEFLDRNSKRRDLPGWFSI